MSELVVVDASIALTRIRRDAGWEDVHMRLRRWRGSGATLVVPSHFWLEVSNSLIRRHRLTGGHLIEAIHRLDEIGFSTVDVDRPLLLLALDRAERHALTTYDAMYLALADSLEGILYTADRALLAAAGSRGLAVAGAADHRLSEDRVPYGSPRQPTWPDYSGASAYLAKLRAEAYARPD